METELTAEDRELLQRLEEELWREETRFDVSRMEEIIAEDFLEFGRSGRIYQRADTLSVPSTPIEAGDSTSRTLMRVFLLKGSPR